MAVPAPVIFSQELLKPTLTFYLRQSDPNLDLPLSATYGGLDNRTYKTGDLLFHDGTGFAPLSTENAGDIIVVDSNRGSSVKWSSSLAIYLATIELYNQKKVEIQNNLDNLNDEVSHLETILLTMNMDKNTLQNKITALNLYVGSQTGDIYDINNYLTNLESSIDDTVITIDNLQSGLDLINIRANNVNTSYNSNELLLSNLSSIITSSQTSINNQQLTATGSINYLINGDFNVWQRSESFGPLLNTSSYITADRWHHSIGHGGLLSSSKSQVTLGSRIVNSLKINLTGNTSSFELSYLLDQVLSGTFTLSFYIRSDISSTFTLLVKKVDGSTIQISSTNVAITNTLTQVSFTFNLPGLVNSGAYYKFSLNGSVWTNVDICRVQLQKGSSVYPFEERSYQSELRLCQRYYETGVSTFGGFSDANETVYSGFTYIVEKRIVPTLSVLRVSDDQFTQTLGIGLTNNTIAGSTYRIKNNRSSFGTYQNQYIADAEVY